MAAAPSERFEWRNHSRVARVVLPALSLAALGFMWTMAVLISKDTELHCDGPSCEHVEHFPFGITTRARVAPVTRARTEWGTGRSAAIELVLESATGTTTTYPGVGTNGDRAEATAAAINQFLETGPRQATFELRRGSTPAAAFMLLLGLAFALAVAPLPFQRLRFEWTGRLVVRRPRWPVPAARFELDGAQLRLGRSTVQSVNGLVRHEAWATDRAGGEPKLLGAFTSERELNEFMDALRGWLSGRGVHLADP